MKKLLPYIVKYKWFLVLTIVFTGIKTISDLLLPTKMADIVDNGIANKDIAYILSTGVIMILIAVVGGVFSIGSRYYASKISISIATDLRQKLFKKITFLSFSEIDTIGSSSLITRTTNDITQVQRVLGVAFRFIFLAPLMFVSTLIIAFRQDAKMTLVILLGTLILSIIMIVTISFSIPLYKKNQKLIDRLNLIVRERLMGIRVIRAFDKTEYEKDKFENASRQLQAVTTSVNRIIAILSPAIQLMFSLLSIALIWFGAFRIDAGGLMLGQLMAFLQYGMQLMFSMMMLVMVFVFVPRAQISIDRIMEVIDIDNEIADDGTVDDTNKNGEIEFKDVKFYYANSDDSEVGIEPAICNISTVLPAGKYNAIIGSTGSGKSTIIKLIERFYEVSSGAIFIDGINIKDYTNSSLKKLVSVSSQKTEILTGTVRSNVDINNCLTDDEVIEALKVAGAYEFVSGYDDGINHELNRAGTNLSGGQKQRISIARAVAKNSAIYIFDDSFSALDRETEQRVKDAVFSKLKDKTIIVIAQKIESIKNANNILVLDDGRLIDNGTHDELKGRCDIYKEIIVSQEGGAIYE